MKKPTKEAIDKLIDEWKARGQEAENAKTQIKNLENCIVALIGQYGIEGELALTEFHLKNVPKIGDYMLTWDHDKELKTYIIKLCTEDGEP